MKKLLFVASFLVLVAILIFHSCKKDKDENESCSDGIQNQNETGVDCGGPCSPCPLSVLCGGNGSNSYLPIKKGNKWEYDYKGGYSGVSGASFLISDSTTYNSKKYYLFEDAMNYNMFFPELYLRTETNGNVYQYTNSQEYLYIPANPVNNQVISTYSDGAQRKVISTNATVKTPDCTYSGCLYIKEFNKNGNFNEAYWYVKGIGMIKDSSYGLTSSVFQLDDITLK